MTAFLTGWSELLLAFVLFVTSHMIPARPAARAWLLRRVGKTGYLVAYTGFSILVFGWLIVAAGRAPYFPLWEPAAWQTWITNVIMPFVCLLLVYGIAAANPLSIASRNDTTYDPDHPGIVGCTRHPVLWAAMLWASAHVPPNGDLAHVIVFCMFAALGIFGALIIDVRKLRHYRVATTIRPHIICASRRTFYREMAPLAVQSRPFSFACCNGSLFQLSDAARHRHWSIAASTTLGHALTV
jgi:uncharacterized membrane protein